MVKESSDRLVSLDILRGLTVAFMILVNSPGSWDHIYPPLRHSEWHGCTPTDLVFPFFLFIAGVSMWYSFKKFGNEPGWGVLLRVLRRVAAIFAVGLFLNIFPYFGRDYSTLRIMGVLQRIALVYGIGSIICLTVKRENLWIVITILLLLYWALLAFAGGNDPYSLNGNIVRQADISILGVNHMYKGFGIAFDPEGILSTLPALGTILIGYYIGGLLGNGTVSWKTSLMIFLLGIASFGLGYLWKYFLPLNKPLWTGSYVLYTAGIAMSVIALFHLFADIWKFRIWGAFFIVFGTNSIFSYFVSGIFIKLLLFIKVTAGSSKMSLYSWIYEKMFVPIAGDLNGSLIFASVQVLLIWGLALVLYRKKILIRL
jgi:predicted acyltransferase